MCLPQEDDPVGKADAGEQRSAGDGGHDPEHHAYSTNPAIMILWLRGPHFTQIWSGCWEWCHTYTKRIRKGFLFPLPEWLEQKEGWVSGFAFCWGWGWDEGPCGVCGVCPRYVTSRRGGWGRVWKQGSKKKMESVYQCMFIIITFILKELELTQIPKERIG